MSNIFNFIKKNNNITSNNGSVLVDTKDEKEKKKKERKDKKKEKGTISAEDLLRLDEVRKSLKLRSSKKKEKLPSGITADYSANFLAAVDQNENREDYSDEIGPRNVTHAKRSNIPTIPPLPPRPPKRTSLFETNDSECNSKARGIDEQDFCQTIISERNSFRVPSICVENYAGSIESLTDSNTTSSFATPPLSLSPVGETHGSPSFATTLCSDAMLNNLTLPALNNATLTKRQISLNLNTRKSDVGICLRKTSTVNRINTGSSNVQFAVVAENNDESDYPLLPGDRLIEANCTAVVGKSREEIVELIKSSGDTAIITVQPLPELSEISQKLSLDHSTFGITGENIMLREKSENEKTDLLQTDRMWFSHQSGFSEVKVLSRDFESGKVKALIQGTHHVTLNDEDLEPANQADLDLCEDLSQLCYLNECSMLHTLRQRYANNLIHTYAGPTMLIINPMVQLDIYSEKLARFFRKCKSYSDMPAHIYSVAQNVYRNAITSHRDHSVVLMGQSASGKTYNYKHLVNYVANVAPPTPSKVLSSEKLDAIWTILEAFGNARTRLNGNATRFTHLFSLDMDHRGLIASASLQIIGYESLRVASRPEAGEGTFHILYWLLAGVEGNSRRQLLLDQVHPQLQNAFFEPVSNPGEMSEATSKFLRVRTAMKTMNFAEDEIRVALQLLSAVIHLGFAGATKGSNGKWLFRDTAASQRAAKCLGTSEEDLSRTLFSCTYLSPNGPKSPGSTLNLPESGVGGECLAFDGVDALEGFAIGIYTEAFNLVGSLINRSICSSATTINSILILDYPGFQNAASCAQKGESTSFVDLCHNYLCERVQALFHFVNLDRPIPMYSQEGLDIQWDKNDDCGSVVGCLDTASSVYHHHSIISDYSKEKRSSSTPRGIFWLLDEATNQAESDRTLVEKIFSNYSERDRRFIQKTENENNLVIRHLKGTNPVTYRVEGWTKLNRQNPFSQFATNTLQSSDDKQMWSIISDSRSTGSGLSNNCSSLVSDGCRTLRRVSSIRRVFTGVSLNKKSACLKIKFTIDGLMETLRRTEITFLQCLLAKHNAATVDCDSSDVFASDNNCKDDCVDVPLLRSQIRGHEILPVVGLYKRGFPKSMPLPEFCRRFSRISALDYDCKDSFSSDDQVARLILQNADVDGSSYKIGTSRVLLRSNALTRLEAKRDELLSETITQLQARCRGYMARKKLMKLKMEDIAIRCIQRNVKKFMSVRDWQWWRLYVKLIPLLNVHRTEQMLKIKLDQVENMSAQIAKLELERNMLRQENDNLDAKLSEMTAELSEETAAASLANERLNLESSERVRLESELARSQDEKKKLQESSEQLELELLCLKSSETNSIVSSTDEKEEDEANSSGGGFYKERYKRAMRELDFTRKKLQQQHRDDLEQLIGLKKQLEKKLSDTYEEVEEQRQVVAQWKRKLQKANDESGDLRLMLEQSNSRNNILEKKQRKFDAELAALQDELRAERMSREKFGREKEIAIGEKYALEQSINELRMDLDAKDQKIYSLNRELEDLTFTGNVEEQVALLRKSKYNLEAKVNEQADELDELAGQVTLLEGAKVRLEMNLEQLRKEHRKELAQKDEEIDEIRQSTVKKMKALECQLENEHVERTTLLRERHELERKLTELGEQARYGNTSQMEQIQKLKRDLKKSKVLLHDAQLMLNRAKTDAPTKAIIRQLRNQLEDTECAKNAAIKAKQIAEVDLMDATASLEESQKCRSELEEKLSSANRQRSQLQSQLDENEEELSDVLKKYRGCVQQLSSEQATLNDQAARISELESERSSLKEQLAEVSSRMELIASSGDSSSSLAVKRLQLKTKELESKLELEQTTKARIEVQISRLKETTERLQRELETSRNKEATLQENVRRLQRSLREAKESLSEMESKESAELAKRKDAEKRLEQAQLELVTYKADLKIAMERIDDLQNALQGDSDEEDDEEENYNDDQSDSDDNASGSSENASLASYLPVNNATRSSIRKWLSTDASIDRTSRCSSASAAE